MLLAATSRLLSLYHRSHAVLGELEYDVVKVGWQEGEGGVLVACQRHVRNICELAGAHARCVIDGVAYDGQGAGVQRDGANVAGRRMVKGEMLRDEKPDAHTAGVEAVEEIQQKGALINQLAACRTQLLFLIERKRKTDSNNRQWYVSCVRVSK